MDVIQVEKSLLVRFFFFFATGNLNIFGAVALGAVVRAKGKLSNTNLGMGKERATLFSVVLLPLVAADEEDKDMDEEDKET